MQLSKHVCLFIIEDIFVCLKHHYYYCMIRAAFADLRITSTLMKAPLEKLNAEHEMTYFDLWR